VCPSCGKLIDYRSEHCKACAYKIEVRAGGKGCVVWKGGRREVRGYIRVLFPEHPRADKRGYVCEHILASKARRIQELEALLNH